MTINEHSIQTFTLTGMDPQALLRCEFCNLTFKRATSLAAHIDSSHDISRVYLCSACSYTTTRVSHFKAHIEVHPNPKRLLAGALKSIPNYCAK
jgi:uncharacterized Zn-finger protein